MPETEEIRIPKALTFDRENHVYRFDGRVVPHNTGILDDQRISDLSGIPQDRLDYKSALGTAVHYAIKLHNENNLDESSLSEALKPYFNGYKRFCEVYKFEPRFTELPLYSRVWDFATTLDIQGPLHIEGKELESIIELKCTWAMYASNKIQTAGQQIAFEENHPDIRIKRRFGLQLKPSNSYELLKYDDPKDKDIFLSALVVYKWRIANGLIK